MSRFIKFCSIVALCTVTLLILVNFLENSVGNKQANYVERGSTETTITEDNKIITNEGRKKLLNLDNFEYTIQPDCDSTLLTWIVTSYAGDPAPRSALRRAYSSEELRELGITRVFLLGLLDDEAERKSGVIQAAVENEANRFQDIVQGNFYEAYRNLTYKHLMGLRWATENCVKASFIMKQDDDIVLNLYDILNRLNLLRGKNEEIFAGYVLRGMKAVREPANKWFVTRDEFDGNAYPDFLSGWLYLVSRQVAAKLVKHSYSCKKYFWIDDVFLTGIFRHQLNINLTDLHELYATDYRYLDCCIRGREKRLKCEFAVGPNGGHVELQVNFQNFAAFCRDRCKTRKRTFSVGKTCVVGYEEVKVQLGSAKIESVQIF